MIRFIYDRNKKKRKEYQAQARSLEHLEKLRKEGKLHDQNKIRTF